LTVLLKGPAKHLHLVLITRKDPPLPRSVLLARNQMTEVRLQDLRFSGDETAAFMQNAVGFSLPDEAIAALAEKTEGWIASLRLAALTLRYSPDADSRVAELRALERNRNLTDYLMSDVLSQTPPAIADFLLKTAILDRMCGPLCEALLGPRDLEVSDQTRLEWLEQSNLFTVSWTTSAAGIATTIYSRVSCGAGWSNGTMFARLRCFTRGPAPGSRVRACLRRRCSTRCWGMIYLRLSA